MTNINRCRPLWVANVVEFLAPSVSIQCKYIIESAGENMIVSLSPVSPLADWKIAPYYTKKLWDFV